MQIRTKPQSIDAHEPTPQERSRAVQAAAHHARDAEELRELLDMLGLAPEEGRARSDGPASAA